MKHLIAVFASFIIFVLTGCGYGPEDEIEQNMAKFLNFNSEKLAEAGLSEPASYIIAFKLGLSSAALQGNSFRDETALHLQEIAQLSFDPVQIKDMQFITSLDMVDPARSVNSLQVDPMNLGERLQLDQGDLAPDFAGLMRVDFDDESSARELISLWYRQGKIHFAEPNGITRLKQGDNLFSEVNTSYQNYNLYSTAWWFASVKLQEAFNQIAARQQSDQNSDADIRGKPPIIAVMDSGVDYYHVGLEGKIWENERINASSCISDRFGCNTTKSVKGYLGTGEVHPYSTPGPGYECDQSAQKAGVCAHGTHVSGIAVGNANASSAGICPVCKVMILRVVKEEDGGIPDSAILNALKYVTLFKRNNSGLVRIINASLGKFQRSKAVGLMVRLLRGAGSGILVIGAAGNEDTMARSYPAAFSDALAVASVDYAGRKAAYSNFGVWVDIAAPGGGGEAGINSSIPGGDYRAEQGTSMAAPVVSGVAGLLVAMDPNISFTGLRDRLISSASSALYSADSEDGSFNRRNYYTKVSGDSVRRPMLGAGLLDAAAAIKGDNNSVGLPGLQSRVEPTCGSVSGGLGHSREVNRFALLMILGLALIAVCVPARVKRRETLQAQRLTP